MVLYFTQSIEMLSKIAKIFLSDYYSLALSIYMLAYILLYYLYFILYITVTKLVSTVWWFK